MNGKLKILAMSLACATLAVTASLSAQNIEAYNAFGLVEELVRIPSAGGGTIELTDLADDGSALAWAEETGYVGVCGRQSGVRFEFHSVGNPDRWDGTAREPFANGFGRRITGLHVLEGRDVLLVVHGEGTVHHLDLQSGAILSTVELPIAVSATDVDEASGRLCVGSDLGGVFIYHVDTLALLATVRPEDSANAVALTRFGNAGTTLLTALYDYHLADDAEGPQSGPWFDAGLTRWDVATGQRLHRYAGPEGTAYAMEYGNKVVGGNADSGLGFAFDAAGNPIPGPTWSRGPVETLTASALDFRVTLLQAGAEITFATDESARLRTRPGVKSPALSLSVHGADFSQGYQDGTVAWYRFHPASGAISVLPLAEILASMNAGYLVQTAAMVGHAAAVEEVCVSESGQLILSRDVDGRVIGWWDLGGGQVGGLTLPVTAAPLGPDRKALSFFPMETGFAVISGDGSDITLFDLGNLANPVVVSARDSSGDPLDLVGAVVTSTVQLVVATRDGGLYELNPATGVIAQTLVAVNPSTPVPALSRVRSWPGSRELFVGPESIDVQYETSHILQFRSSTDITAITKAVPQQTLGSHFVPHQFGLQMVVAEDYHRGLAVLFDVGSTLTAVSWIEGVNPSGGIASVGPQALLAVGGGEFQAIRTAQSQLSLETAPVPGLPIRTLGSSPATQIAYLGLETGTILRVLSTLQ